MSKRILTAPMNRPTLLSLLCFASLAAAQSSHVVHYDLKMQDLKTIYGGVPPVMHVKPGDTIDYHHR